MEMQSIKTAYKSFALKFTTVYTLLQSIVDQVAVDIWQKLSIITIDFHP